MIIDGRAIARDILADVQRSVAGIAPLPLIRAIAIEPNEATRSYMRIKARAAQDAGMMLEMAVLGSTVSEVEVINAINAPGAGSVIVQLPLPDRFDTNKVLESIPAHLDADVLALHAPDTAPLPPVVGAVREILIRAGIRREGIRAVVVGQGRLVGTPVAAWLRTEGTELTVLDDRSFSTPEGAAALRAADLIVTGAGVAGLLMPDLIKEGVVLIDAGTSEQGGVLAGDIDAACAEKAALFTPVPGGVGPVTVACLMRNAAELAQKARFDEATGEA